MKKLKLSFLIIAMLGGLIFFWLYRNILSPNTHFPQKEKVVLVRTGSNYKDLLRLLVEDSIIKDSSSFQLVARLKEFGDPIKPGRYIVPNGMNNRALVNMLRAGNQRPLLVPIENTSSLDDLAGLLSKFLETDSLRFSNYFQDPANSEKIGLSVELLPSLFIANRYEMFWTISPEQFIEKMEKIHSAFWTPERLAKAKEIGLSPEEVYTLASIVRSESAKADEASRIAGLYMNRLSIGMRLQSDPTALFAGKKKNVQRVWSEDLQVVSPYNTYENAGLPPGPICLVEKNYIDAVLNYERNNFLYMCAKSDFSGYHNFSRTLAQHETFRTEYRRALNKKNIRR